MGWWEGVWLWVPLGEQGHCGSHHSGKGGWPAWGANGSGSGEAVPPLSFLALSPLIGQLARESRHSLLLTVAKTGAESVLVLARPEPGLRPRQMQGACKSRPSHRPPAWGGIPVSTLLNSIHSTHTSGATSMCQSIPGQHLPSGGSLHPCAHMRP